MNSSKNNRILFVVSSYHQYQNYIQTKSLEEVKDRVYFIVHPSLAKADFGVYKDRIFIYGYPDKKNAWHRHIFHINTFKKRKQKYWVRNEWIKENNKKIYTLLANPVLYKIFKLFVFKIGEDNNLVNLVKKIDPAIVLLPSHAFEGITFELIRISRKLKIPNLMIVENWDTLANKTLFSIKPDYLGVWGQQHIEHALTAMEMPKDSIILLGAPKFTKYTKLEAKTLPSPYPFKYALFTGMTDYFDELSSLRKMDEIIGRKGLDITVVYRPTSTQHVRKCPDVFFEYDFKHVVMDTAARSYYKKSISWDISKQGFDPKFFPDPSYFPALFSNMEFMVTAHSTMMLECAFFDKRIYALDYDDGVHRLGPHWAYKNARHLFEIERLENVRMVDKIEDMEKMFDSGRGLKEPVNPVDINYFVSKKETADYPANLKRVVDGIISGKLS